MNRATGRLVNHDPQNRAYAAPRRSVRPISWLHRFDGPRLDQGWLGGCTGWTGANFLNCAAAVGNRRKYHQAQGRDDWPSVYLGNADGETLYSLATLNDPFDWQYPPEDGGSSGLGVAKAMKGMGVIERFTWTFDFGNALGWAQRQPVMLGVLWTDPMSDPDEDGIIHIGSAADLRRADANGTGHEVLWRGCRWDRKLARLTNQWSSAWGLDGDALIPIEELETLVMDWRGDVCVPELAQP